jgi:localization factor PodJL
MKTGNAWNVRGVDEDTREAVLEAARQSGVSVGEWLNLVIADDDGSDSPPKAVSEIGQGRESVASIPSDEEFTSLLKRLRWGERSGKLSDSGQRLQKSVPEMVAELARELDTTDEYARSSIEGKRAPESTADTITPEVTAALGNLNQRIAAMDERMDRAAKVENNTSKLDDISVRLNSLLARDQAHRDPPPARPVPPRNDWGLTAPATTRSSISETLLALEERLRLARRRLSSDKNAVNPAGQPAPALPDEHDQNPCAPTPFAAAVEEISRRQGVLGEEVARSTRQEGEAVSGTAAATCQDMSALMDQIRTIGTLGAQTQATTHDLTRRIDSLVAEQPLRQEQIAVLSAEIRRNLEAITQEAHQDRDRLDALSEQVAMLSQSLHNQSDAAAISGLESQVADLSLSVEVAINAVVNPPVDPLLQRLEDQVNEMSQRIGKIMAEAPPAGMQDHLRSEIDSFREDLAAMSRTDAGHLEEQIHELSGRVDNLSRSDPSENTLSELEGRISRLAAEIEHNQVGQETLQRVENNLASVHTDLKASEQQARAAARDAVREFSAVAKPTLGDVALIAELKDDLENLRHITGASEVETRATLEAVNQTVQRVTERVARLESETPTTDITGQVSAPAPNDPAAPASRDAPPFAPPHKPADSPAANRAAPSKEDQARIRRAEFIAAARRAALAADSNSAALMSRAPGQEEEAPETAPSPRSFARIKHALGRRKRALLLTGAIIVALGVMQLYGNVSPSRATAALITEPGFAAKTEAFLNTATATAMPVPETAALAPAPGDTVSALVAPTANTSPGLPFAASQSVHNRFVKQRPAAQVSLASNPVSSETAEFNIADWPPELVRAGKSGDASAAFEIAARYAHGTHGARDMPKAREWYEKAAVGGIAVAQYRLGSLYERGEGGPKEPSLAEIWYQRAADKGNINAMHNLAVLMSASGTGKALQWFTTAADYGVMDSQYNLGVIYARALGTPRDLAMSYKWFALAAASGDQDAAKRRDEIAGALSRQDLTNAEASVAAWSAKKILTDANTVSSVWTDNQTTVTGDRQAMVQKTQGLLTLLGFDPGPADGLDGPQTRDAVIAFQRKTGIATTGNIDHQLVAALTQSGT